MPLLSYNPMEDGEAANANLWNVRLSAIHDLLNGNIDAANIKNGSVTTPKIADGAVTSSKISTSKYVDDNGWTVHDMGTFKTYSYSYPVSNITIPYGIRKDNMPTINPPQGKNRNSLVYATSWYGGYAGHAIPGLENSGESKIAVMLANQYAPAGGRGSLVFNGTIFITATDRV